MLSSPDKSFFAPVCAVMAARQISPVLLPHKAVFCTEVMLHSLGGGLGFLEQVPVCCRNSWGHISSLGTCHHTGFFLQQAGSIHIPSQGLQDSGGTCWDWQSPPSSLWCCEVGPVCPPSLPPRLCYG